MEGGQSLRSMSESTYLFGLYAFEMFSISISNDYSPFPTIITPSVIAAIITPITNILILYPIFFTSFCSGWSIN
jgi:hypothetical protein